MEIHGIEENVENGIESDEEENLGNMSHHEEEKHEEVEMHGIEGSVENGIESEEQENLENMSNHEEEKHEEEKEELSIEAIFANKEVPSWEKQLTVRALVVSLVMSVVFSFITMNLNLTTGIIPSLNISAGLLGFFFVKTWTKLLEKCGFLKQPFTRQENTVIQTCVVAASGMAFSGGFGSYLFAMSERVIKQSEGGNTGYSYKNLTLGWMIGFLLLVGFRGLFTMVPLRKILVIDLKLPYPSGTATAHLINSFHTPEGAKIAKQQVRELGKFFSFSFLWGFFQWFFTAGNDCGFASFPTFGLKAYQYSFHFDLSATYVGVGMICPHVTNLSVLVGGILSWGVMWPLIETKSGDWYPKGLSHNSLQGLQGYKVFIGIAMILGDGLYYFFKVLRQTITGLVNKIRERDANMHLTKAITGLVTKIRERDANMHLPVADFPPPTVRPLSYDDQCRTKLFLKEQIPLWFAVVGYLIISSISALILPHLIHQLKWYYITAIYVFAPVLAFCNAFGCGLTDWSLASSYGKLAIFTIGAWAGASHGGVLVGLASCGVMMNIVSTASDLMQDFKTGYLTLTSPRSMFVSQLIGTAIGCVIGPCVFWIFYKAFPDLGMPGSTYPAPFATVYYNLAKLGVEGFSALPKNCLNLSYAFFSAAILINIIKDVMGQNRRQFIPIPTAMAIPFYIGSYFAIDMCVGSLIVYIWQRINKTKANAFAPAVASGLICGDGIWTLPASILAIAGVKPPLCMRFLSRRTNNKVDTFLEGLG